MAHRKASNSNEQAALSQSPVLRRPLTSMALDDSPSSPRNFYRTVTWDMRSTPLRMKDPAVKRPPPEISRKFKRHKSSPVFLKFDKEERNIEDEQKRLSVFKSLLVAGQPPPPRRNFMEEINEHLNDSLSEGLMIKEADELQPKEGQNADDKETMKTENNRNDDSFLSAAELAEMEAIALKQLQEMEQNDEVKVVAVTSNVPQVAPSIPQKVTPNPSKEKEVKSASNPRQNVQKVATSVPSNPQRNIPQVTPKKSDDFDIDSEEMARIEAEALKQLKAQEFEDISQIASEDFRAKPMATSTQFDSTQSNDSDIDEDEINRMFAEGEKLLKQQENEELSQVERKFEDCFTNPRATSTQIQFQPLARAPTIVNQPSASNAAPSTISQADRERIERNRREALRRREMYQQNQRRLNKK